MKHKLKEIINSSFYQLLVVYTLLIIAITLGLFWKYTLHFEIFAVIIALFGITIACKKEVKINKKLHYALFALAILLILATRITPYIGNDIPLGYDAGMYKYAIESGLQNQDPWIFQIEEPGFLYMMSFFKLFLPLDFILIYLFILFNVLLGIAIYFFTKEYFNKESALIAILLYAVSLIQFKTFGYMYYRNIIGLSLMLFSLYFLKRYKKGSKLSDRILFILLAALTGAMHRPTFYILGLTYLAYSFINPYKNKKYDSKKLQNNTLSGILILLIFSLFYLGKFRPMIFGMFEPVLGSFVQPGMASGTFINFLTYQFATLAYLPFAILGFFYLIKKKQFNILFLWTLINASIVYFQFFFFNRFIIHLDIALIILASAGFMLIIENKKKLGIAIVIIMLLSLGFITFTESKNAGPPIIAQEFDIIKSLSNTESNAFVMATSSQYSPWIQGYSERRTIAPGLFDYDRWNRTEWVKFWGESELEATKEMLSVYEKPLYIFIGRTQVMNMQKFNNSCFYLTVDINQTKIYKYVC